MAATSAMPAFCCRLFSNQQLIDDKHDLFRKLVFKHFCFLLKIMLMDAFFIKRITIFEVFVHLKKWTQTEFNCYFEIKSFAIFQII